MQVPPGFTSSGPPHGMGASSSSTMEVDIDEKAQAWNKLNSKRASKRPIQREKETLDIEPLDDKKFISENQKVESVEIDDPW